MNKLLVGIIFGGKSSEHEISIMSAKNVVGALDAKKYIPVLIYIDKKGVWFKIKKFTQVADGTFNKEKVVTFDAATLKNLDVIFPVLHGTNGEDGTMQGLLTLAGVPFVGAGVAGSIIGMDKDVAKRLLRDAGLPIGKFLVFRDKKEIDFNNVKKTLGLPLFVKPANNGSSVGVSKVHDEEEFAKAINLAFQFDNKVLVEEYIKGREIECSVLGNDYLAASLPGEIIPTHEFYDYQAKYIDAEGARTDVPAKLKKIEIKKIQELAIHVFKVLECRGMARVDVFLTEKGEVYVNEINTIPGFTNISMYPKMWEASGISYQKLIGSLIKLATEEFESRKKLKTSYA